LIGDFMTDGIAYSDDEAQRQCEIMIKVFLDKSLLKVEHRDTIVAEKLSNPIVINEIKGSGHTGVVREDDFLDPFLNMDKTEGNYNSFESKPWELKKKKRGDDKEKDALDKKIEEFMAHKKRVPPPIVIHDKEKS
jgi:hypothetical protein